MSYDLRLVAYAPNGARRGVLHYIGQAQAALPFNELSSLKLSVPVEFAEASYLNSPCEIALEVSEGGAWFEPPNGRFLRLQWEINPAKAHPEFAITAPGYAWLLSKAGIEGATKPWFRDEDDKSGSYDRRFLSANAGQILSLAIAEAKALGSLPGLEIDFTASLDSDGKSWAGSFPEITYTPGLPILDILEDLVSQGLVDWRVEGRRLRVFNQDAYLAKDHTATSANPVVLRLGQDVTDAPTRGDLSTVVHRAILRGDEGRTWWRENSALQAPWGKFQSVTNQSSVTEGGTAQTLLDGVLRQGAAEIVEMTRDIRFESARHSPLIDYEVGDYIFAPNTAGLRERVRVRQVTIEKDTRGRVSGNLILNDRFTESAVRQARRMRGIQGGASVGPGGSSGGGAVPGTRPEDDRVPAAPSTVSAGSTAYLDNDGRVRSLAHVAWASVISATDGSSMAVSGYQVWVRNPRIGSQFVHVATVDGTSYDYGPTDPGLTVTFRVHAVARRNQRVGPYRQASTLTAADDEPPAVPSKFTDGGSRLGTIVAHWDGRDENGNPMARDLDFVEVAAGPFSDTEASVDTLRGEGNTILVGYPYDEPTFVRARAWDTSGNVSDWSEAASFTPQRLLDSDYVGTPIHDAIQDQLEQIQTIEQGVIEAKQRADQAYAQALAAISGGENLFLNGGFENNGEFWDADSGTLAIQNDPASARSGDYYAIFDGTILAETVVQVEHGNAYHVEAYVAGPNGPGEMGLAAKIIRANGDYMIVKVPAVDLADFAIEVPFGQWAKVSTTVEIEDPTIVEAQFGLYSDAQIAVDDARAIDISLANETRKEVDQLAQDFDTLSVQTQAALLGKTSIWTDLTPPATGQENILWMIPGQPVRVWDDATDTWVPIMAVAQAQVHHEVTPPGAFQGSVVGETWFMHTNLGASGRLTGMWQWDGTAWRAKTIDETFLPQVNIGTGTYGTLSGVRLEAGTVATDSLVVGLDNKVVDPIFNNPDLRSRRAVQTQVAFTADAALPSSSYAMLCGSPTTASTTNTSFGVDVETTGAGSYVPVAAGERVALRAFVRQVGTGSPSYFQFYVWRRHKNAAGTLQTTLQVAGAHSVIYPTTTGEWHEHVYDVPEDTVGVQFGVRCTTPANSRLAVEQPFWTLQSHGVTIRDGAVSAPKIQANAVTSDHIEAGAVDTPHLRADAVDATRLDADAVTAKHTITGALVQTSGTANRGVKVRSDGVSGYNLSGQRRFYLSASSGNLETYGVFRASNAADTVRVEVTPAAYGNRPGVRFDHGLSAQLLPVIYSVGPGVDDYPNRALVMHGSESTINSSGRAELVLEHGGDFKLAQSHGSASGTGIHKNGRYLDVRGRHRSGVSEVQTVCLRGDWHSTESESVRWNIVNASPLPVGYRNVIAGAEVASEWNTATASVYANNAAGFSIFIRKHYSGLSSIRYVYTATWV